MSELPHHCTTSAPMARQVASITSKALERYQGAQSRTRSLRRADSLPHCRTWRTHSAMAMMHAHHQGITACNCKLYSVILTSHHLHGISVDPSASRDVAPGSEHEHHTAHNGALAMENIWTNGRRHGYNPRQGNRSVSSYYTNSSTYHRGSTTRLSMFR